MKNIYTYVAKDGYAARVQDTRSYDAVRFVYHSTFPPSRLTIPFPARTYCQDGPFLLSQITITQVHTHTSIGGETNISLGITPLSYRGMLGSVSPRGYSLTDRRTCTVGTNTLIGSHSHIFENAVITSSVIGRRCKVHPRAKITNSYVFDETTIEADCVITDSIIGGKVNLKEGTVVEKGCLIADEVVIGPKGLVKEFERVSKRIGKPQATSDADDEDEDSELEDVDEGRSVDCGTRHSTLFTILLRTT